MLKENEGIMQLHNRAGHRDGPSVLATLANLKTTCYCVLTFINGMCSIATILMYGPILFVDILNHRFS